VLKLLTLKLVSCGVEVSLLPIALSTIDLGGEFNIDLLYKSLLCVFIMLISDSLSISSISKSIAMSLKAESWDLLA
jgi:hypothetical protein